MRAWKERPFRLDRSVCIYSEYLSVSLCDHEANLPWDTHHCSYSYMYCMPLKRGYTGKHALVLSAIGWGATLGCYVYKAEDFRSDVNLFQR